MRARPWRPTFARSRRRPGSSARPRCARHPRPSAASPIAPRDFRLTAADAARLRRRGFLGRAGVSTWPAGLARGVGGALATLGLVGLLVSAGLPAFSGGAASAPTREELGSGGAVDGASPVPAMWPPATDLYAFTSSSEPPRTSDASGDGTSPVPTPWRVATIVSFVALVTGLALLLIGRARHRHRAVREPGRPPARQSGEMSTRNHGPDAGSHDRHDRLLVAAAAAGDLAGPELARAEALLATCPDCRVLHAELLAIATATRHLPAPVRPPAMDFRITPDRAAELARGGLWRRLLRPFGRPGSGTIRPLAAAFTTLGLAGLMLADPAEPPAGRLERRRRLPFDRRPGRRDPRHDARARPRPRPPSRRPRRRARRRASRPRTVTPPPS